MATDGHTVVLSAGRFDDTSREELRAIFEAASAQGAKNIVVHFHGGLVDKAAGLGAARQLIPIYQAAGAYPIFFIWESGWFEVIERNMPAIFRETIFQRIVAAVSRGSKAKVTAANGDDGARSIEAMPPEAEIIREMIKPAPFAGVAPDLPSDTSISLDEYRQFEQMLESDAGFEADVLQLQTAVRNGTAAGQTLMSPEVLEDPRAERGAPDDVAKGVISMALMTARAAIVLGRVVSRFSRKRHHGFYLTVVEEVLRGFYLGNVGKFFWDQMKKDIDAAFGFSPECGGTAFVGEIVRLMGGETPPKLTFVAHSAGSIYACRLLREMRTAAPAVRVSLILVAAAVDMKTLAETLRAAGGQVDGFRSFGMSDQFERQDELFGKLFPGSLLYLVSGVLEEEADMPLAGMERFYTSDFSERGLEYVAAVRQFDICSRPHSFVWAPFDRGLGMACDMRSHGGWIDAAATMNSVKYIISNGFGYEQMD